MSVVSSKLVDALAKANVDQEFLDLLEAELRKIRVPVGAIMPYRGTTPPEGWLIVNGQNVYESVYPDLYNFLKAQPNAKTGTDETGAYVKCELPHHRVIELTTTLSEVGQLVEAGLPDISGAWANVYSTAPSVSSGCASFNYPTSEAKANIVGGAGSAELQIHAHSSSAIYGSSDTVRMASLRALAIIKF